LVGPSLMWADVWATAAVARGATAPDWAGTLKGTSGILVMADKTVHRWGATSASGTSASATPASGAPAP
jgi:hypothetical protein